MVFVVGIGKFSMQVFLVKVVKVLLPTRLMEEILHHLIGSSSHYLQGFLRPRWLAGFLPSTVLPVVLTL